MYDIIKNEKGFSLIEILFAVALIGLLSIVIFQLFTNGIVRQRKFSIETTAWYYAQKAVEQIKVDKRNNGFNYITQDNYEDSSYNNIDRSILIYNINSDLKKICVNIKWADRTDSLVSYIGNY